MGQIKFNLLHQTNVRYYLNYSQNAPTPNNYTNILTYYYNCTNHSNCKTIYTTKYFIISNNLPNINNRPNIINTNYFICMNHSTYNSSKIQNPTPKKHTKIIYISMYNPIINLNRFILSLINSIILYCI